MKQMDYVKMADVLPNVKEFETWLDIEGNLSITGSISYLINEKKYFLLFYDPDFWKFLVHILYLSRGQKLQNATFATS